MDTRPWDIFYNEFITPTGDRVEDINGIKVPTPSEIDISELPEVDPALYESGRAFLRFFETHEDRVEEIQDLGDLHKKEYDACLKKLEDLLGQLFDAQAEAHSKKCKKIRQRIDRTKRRLEALPIHTAVARIARCEGQIQYCEVAYMVYITNTTRGGNHALALLVGGLSMRSPYGVIELEMLENIGLKRLREKRTKDLRETCAARACGEAAAGVAGGETDYETAEEKGEEEDGDGSEGYDAKEAEEAAEDEWEAFGAEEADFEGFDAPEVEEDAVDTANASNTRLTSRMFRKVNRNRRQNQ